MSIATLDCSLATLDCSYARLFNCYTRVPHVNARLRSIARLPLSIAIPSVCECERSIGAIAVNVNCHTRSLELLYRVCVNVKALSLELRSIAQLLHSIATLDRLLRSIAICARMNARSPLDCLSHRTAVAIDCYLELPYICKHTRLVCHRNAAAANAPALL